MVVFIANLAQPRQLAKSTHTLQSFWPAATFIPFVALICHFHIAGNLHSLQRRKLSEWRHVSCTVFGCRQLQDEMRQGFALAEATQPATGDMCFLHRQGAQFRVLAKVIRAALVSATRDDHKLVQRLKANQSREITEFNVVQNKP
ncbi:hypothetical protein, conserved in T. vivax [Trypanosoma vivax Y486]|uniref:Uncharacterized protein n=1 Tax=Trypanosoma vivax (strain Y486) TaxID=1055687 RepID=F9WUQ0_TRYVY|nr:hypothetical protein, conserved in T. vivax [Trypanosoma vivax Y486]|eukprot:CCD21299.1 hypothetical protein, conserved in T. vivax [Trypanosoma vivax Y486]